MSEKISNIKVIAWTGIEIIPGIIGIYEAQVCLNINRMPLKIALAKRIITKSHMYHSPFKMHAHHVVPNICCISLPCHHILLSNFQYLE